MFGYIKPVKAELKVKEWEAYQGIYCGLCKQLAKRYGFFARMTLNYDFVFLAMENGFTFAGNIVLSIPSKNAAAAPATKVWNSAVMWQ